jgi:hypothetical protein
MTTTLTDESPFGKCPRCFNPNNAPNWCSSCVTEIYSSQTEDDSHSAYQKYSTNIQSFTELIPYNRLRILNKLGEGGFGTVYKAEWLDGEIEKIDIVTETIQRKGPQIVALKKTPQDFDEIYYEVK